MDGERKQARREPSRRRVRLDGVRERCAIQHSARAGTANTETYWRAVKAHALTASFGDLLPSRSPGGRYPSSRRIRGRSMTPVRSRAQRPARQSRDALSRAAFRTGSLGPPGCGRAPPADVAAPDLVARNQPLGLERKEACPHALVVPDRSTL